MVEDIQVYATIRQEFVRRKSEQDILRKNLRKTKDEIAEIERKIESGKKARIVIQEVAQRTQQNLEYHISNLVTTALNAIWSEPLEFLAKIVVRRNKTECDLLIREGDKEPVSLLDTRGGGVLDVVSFALRITYWSLKKTRPTFILDEPFKFVSPDRQRFVSDMLKMLSEKLGIQILMVSHAEQINYSADKTFLVRRVGEKSICEESTDEG